MLLWPGSLEGSFFVSVLEVDPDVKTGWSLRVGDINKDPGIQPTRRWIVKKKWHQLSLLPYRQPITQPEQICHLQEKPASQLMSQDQRKSATLKRPLTFTKNEMDGELGWQSVSAVHNADSLGSTTTTGI